MLKKALEEEYAMQYIHMQKLLSNIWKTVIKSKESSYLKYWDVNNLHGLAMPQILPVNNFEWIDDTSQLNKHFIKHDN